MQCCVFLLFPGRVEGEGAVKEQEKKTPEKQKQGKTEKQEEEKKQDQDREKRKTGKKALNGWGDGAKREKWLISKEEF